ADQLNNYATMQNEPNFFEADLERFRNVKPFDVQRVANKYLSENKFVLTVLPKPGANGGFAPASLISNGTGSIADVKQNVNKHQRGLQNAENVGGLYVPPVSKPTPKLVLPEIERHFLSNGLELLFVRRSQLPILSLNLILKTGGAANPLEKFGLSSLTAGLLNQGTETRTAIEISNELLKIGAQLGTGSGWDSSSIALLTLTKNIDRALEIFADVATNPIFPENEFETYRKRLLAALLQQKDNPNAIAGSVFNSILYSKKHPYGNNLAGDEKTLEGLTQADLGEFYATYYHPNNAVLIIVGDIKKDDLLSKLEATLANWQPSEIPSINLPEITGREKSEVYLVDKPDSAQSVITIGQVGAARSTPDYFALQVMNSLLGGQFTSRVNMNLREDKGYTYGARTGFDWRLGAAPFAASASVQTAVTKESVTELLRELNEIRGIRPITEKELAYNQQSIVRRYPSAFETAGQIAGQLAGLVIYDLPDSYFNDYISSINAVTLTDANRVAREYLKPEKMAIVIVGDRKTVEPRLREIPDVEINFLDTEGQTVD
ncbi:MAG: insulinase family protein, partial [Pyrinomonadaceae bacterium]